MKNLLIVLVLCCFQTVFSQKYTRMEVLKLEDADIDFEIGDYKSAVEVYEVILKKHPGKTELTLKSGISYFMLRKYDEASKYLEQTRELGEYEANFYLGQIYHLKGKLNEEIDLYHEYLERLPEAQHTRSELDRLISQAEYAQEMMARPVHVEIVNMGSALNTEYHEYVPLVYGSEEEIYFTSRRPGSTGGKLDFRGDFFEDIYVSKFQYGFWQPPEQLPDKINTSTHDACVGISTDGEVLYLFRTSEDQVSGDLYSSRNSLMGWTEPELLAGEINSDAIETSVSVSDDDHTIFFSSNREGGYGGMDIYRVKKLPNGEWSKALNLGPAINTERDEDSPFIHADGKTLYFISNGHKSLGGYDIFQSTLDERENWTKPINMGYPINTLSNDMNFVMSSDKLSGYYSSSVEGGFGGQDLYKIKFRQEAEILSVVKGGVESSDTAHVPIEASITLIDNRTKSVQGIYKSNPATGQFVMIITPESSYQVIVEADGYHTYSGELYFDSSLGFASSIEEFKLIPLQVSSNE